MWKENWARTDSCMDFSNEKRNCCYDKIIGEGWTTKQPTENVKELKNVVWHAKRDSQIIVWAKLIQHVAIQGKYFTVPAGKREFHISKIIYRIHEKCLLVKVNLTIDSCRSGAKAQHLSLSLNERIQQVYENTQNYNWTTHHLTTYANHRTYSWHPFL